MFDEVWEATRLSVRFCAACHRGCNCNHSKQWRNSRLAGPFRSQRELRVLQGSFSSWHLYRARSFGLRKERHEPRYLYFYGLGHTLSSGPGVGQLWSVREDTVDRERW